MIKYVCNRKPFKWDKAKSSVYLYLQSGVTLSWFIVIHLNILFAVKYWTICYEEMPPLLWEMMEEEIHSTLCAPQIPIKTQWCSGLVAGEAISGFMKPLLNLFSGAFEGIVEDIMKGSACFIAHNDSHQSAAWQSSWYCGLKSSCCLPSKQDYESTQMQRLGLIMTHS